MNILFILPEYYPHPGGGIATYYLKLLPEIVRQGHKVKVIVGSGVVNGIQSYTVDQVEIDYLKPELFKKYLPYFAKFSIYPEIQRHLAAAWAMWEQVAYGASFDIIETTDWGLGFVPWILQLDGPPVVLSLHGSIGQIEYHDPRSGYELHGDICRLIESSIIPLANLLIGHSIANIQEWSTLLKQEIKYIPPAFGVPEKLQIRFDNSPLVIGRVQYWKGPIVLCQAVELSKRNIQTIEWIGRDTYFHDSQSMSEYLHEKYPQVWEQVIQPVGAKPNQEVLEKIQSAKFGIVPSVWDVFNYTCIEWMSNGKVVICSTGAGASHLIRHGENGFLFNSEDAKELGNLLNYVDELTETQIKAIGEQAYYTIKQQLNPVKVAQQRLTEYGKMNNVHLRQTPVNEWLKNFLSPSNIIDNTKGTLDKLPLKILSEYVLNRTIRKVKSL